MHDVIEIAVSVPAWFETSLTPGAKPPHPDLRLHVLGDADEVLTVELDEGIVTSTEPIVLAGHGLYEVAATLRCQDGGGERVYLRLVPAKSQRGRGGIAA